MTTPIANAEARARRIRIREARVRRKVPHLVATAPREKASPRPLLERWQQVLTKQRPQNALTMRAFVAPERLDELRGLLARDAPSKKSSILSMALDELGTVHFARFVLLEEADDGRGKIPPSLVFCSDFDGTVDAHIEVLAVKSGLDGVFRCCEGFPDEPHPRERATFLRANRIPEVALYANTLGRTVEQIRREDALHRHIDALIDGTDWSRTAPEAMRKLVQQSVLDEPELAWARTPVIEFDSPAWDRIRRRLESVDIAGLLDRVRRLLFFVPRQDDGPPHRATNAHVRFLTGYEDWAPQNAFGAIDFVEDAGFLWLRGLVSLVPLLVILPVADWLTYGVYNKGNLAEVRSIHFARWVVLDYARTTYGFRAPRRGLFFSNYDGSQENYMGEFVDTVAWGLNATFSRALTYPKSFAFVFDGAKNEQAFKNFIRRVQLQTDVWYSAYPHLSAANINNNAEIRRGLFAQMDGAEVEAWLRRL